MPLTHHLSWYRYMSTPSDNPTGYDNTRVMDPKRVHHFRDVSYLLIHGTADDNVHFQNAMHLTTALIREEIPFETQVYPDKNHAISGASYRSHLYSKIADFFVHKCQRKTPTPKRVKRSIEAEEEEGEAEVTSVSRKRRSVPGRQTCFEKDFADCI